MDGKNPTGHRPSLVEKHEAVLRKGITAGERGEVSILADMFVANVIRQQSATCGTKGALP